ncbi:hypothetical protein BDZ94DRAFT_1178351 [Collybia nuda]|uniref:RBR-type E3 ubiquitin transferase n=1 Tax=Collybia nuda TaxID=64659 RepID=A0A9P6CBK8_9AGAR|nr:hypothetical protein BDZ94DRAFT_1178351 [Collybia nuda]
MLSISDAELLECKGLREEEYGVIESIHPGYSSGDIATNVLKLEIPVDFPDAKTVTIVQDETLGLTSTSVNTDMHAQQIISVSSLPPLVISLTLPPSYPLYSPPHIASIHANHAWLPHQCPPLRAILMKMWQPGEGVLYNWIEFIRTGEFLYELSFMSATDGHTIQITHPSPQVLAPLLKAFDVSAKSIQFSQNSYPCPICLISVKGSRCVQLNCGHIFCRSCLEEFWKMCIAEGEVGRVGCPDPECVKLGREADVEDIVRVVTQTEMRRYRWLKEKKALEKDPSIVHCPMTFCQNPVPKPSDQNDGSGWERLRSCSRCSFSFCAFCRRTWHGPITSCPIAYSEKLVLEYLAHSEGSIGRQSIETRFGRTNVLKLIATYEEERANKEWLEASTMACPGCQIHVEKSLGCNHMTCAKCHQHFCYRCGTKLPGSDPYKHFSTTGQPCYNKLFDFQAETEEWQPLEGFEAH